MGDRVSFLQRRFRLDPGRIVDSYVSAAPCFWKASGLSRLGPGARAATDRTAGQMDEAKLSDLIEDMDRARVTVSLVVLHEETDEFFRLAAEHPGRIFGLAYYDSLSPRRGLERVQGLCHDYPHLVLGVATAMPGLGQDPRLRDFAPLYEFCAERGLPVHFHGEDKATGGGLRPMAYAVLARNYPRLKVVCQHGESWHGQARALLSRFPNLFLQVDGLSLPTPLRARTGRKLLFGSGWWGREAGYFARAEAVRRLPWWQRRNLGWRTAVRVHGSRILCPSGRSNTQPSPR